MDESAHILSRRLSLESTTTSEFEVVPRERSASESTVEGSDHTDEVSLSDVPFPPNSLPIPALFSDSIRNEQYLPSLAYVPEGGMLYMVPKLAETPAFPPTSPPRSIFCVHHWHITASRAFRVDSIPQPPWSNRDHFLSQTSSATPVSESGASDASLFAKETLWNLEQILNGLTSINERCKLLDQKVEKAEHCMEIGRMLEEKNRVLQKSLHLANNKVEQLAQEVEKLQKKLSTRSTNIKERQEQHSTSTVHSEVIVMCVICAVVAVLAVCVGLLRARNVLVPEFL